MKLKGNSEFLLTTNVAAQLRKFYLSNK